MPAEFKIEGTPITGEEDADSKFPLGGLAQFYRAFNNRDLTLMAKNWLIDGDIAMDNPLGGICRQWRDIEAVYTRLFGGPNRVRVALGDYTVHEGGELFYAVGRERGVLISPSSTIDLAFRTTRIFRRNRGLWRQAHHHGSIEDPRLLEQYQSLFA